MGLILTDSDGKRRSVGQVRLDHLGPVTKVTTAGMWLEVPDHSPKSSANWFEGNASNGYHGASGLRFSQPTREEEQVLRRRRPPFRYLPVPCRGRIDWLFCNEQCHISHHEASRVWNEIDEVIESEFDVPESSQPENVVRLVLGEHGIRGMY